MACFHWCARVAVAADTAASTADFNAAAFASAIAAYEDDEVDVESEEAAFGYYRGHEPIQFVAAARRADTVRTPKCRSTESVPDTTDPPSTGSNDAEALEADKEEDECREVSPPPRPPPTRTQGDDFGDGVVLVGIRGGLLMEDMPHARADCPLRPFATGAAKRTIGKNEAACAHCWCYVCQHPVADCIQWTSLDTARPAHCNAHGGNVIWKRMKRLLQTVTD